MGNIHSETDLQTLMTHYDSVSGTYDVIVTYVISHLFPKHVVQRIEAKTSQKFQKAITTLRQVKRECISLKSGSSAEGLSLPEIYHVSKAGLMVSENPDDDILIIDNVYVDNTIEMALANNGDFYLDTTHTYPGFTRIRVLDPTKVRNEMLVKRVENGEVIYYMSKHEIQQLRGDESTPMSGPAVTKDFPTNISFKHATETKNWSVPGEMSQDLVYAVNTREWPDFMKDWRLRQTTNKVLGSFPEMHYGFFLVGAAHRYSKDPEVEWRMSCSLPELFLAHELTLPHRQAYMAFKYLVKEATKGQKGIMTYHLKTTLFWTVETTPSSMWSEGNLAQCLYLLLDRFINFLAQKNLPNYFIPKSNLFEHLSSDHIITSLRTIMRLREDPLGHILKYQKRLRMERHGVMWGHAFEFILFPHLETASKNLNKYGSHPQVNLILLRRCLFESTLDLSAAKLTESSFEDTFDMMMTYLNLPAAVRTDMETLPFQEHLYNFLAAVCRQNFRTRKANTGLFFLDSVKKRLKAKGILTDVTTQRLALLKACMNQLLAKYADDTAVAESHWNQSALVFDSFNLEKDDLVTATEYSCFYYQLWSKGDINNSQILETAKCMTLFQCLLPTLQNKLRNPDFQFYGIWKLLCFNVDCLEPNLTAFLEPLVTCYIPHEIILLFVNIMIVRKILLPNMESLMAHLRSECHNQNDTHGSSTSKVDKHVDNIAKLQALRKTAITLSHLADQLLYNVIMAFNVKILTLHLNAPSDRLISGVGVNFLLGLSMMYAQRWEHAIFIFSDICFRSLPTDQVLSRYRNICILLVLFQKYNELPIRKVLVPTSQFGFIATIAQLLNNIPKNNPKPETSKPAVNKQGSHLEEASSQITEQARTDPSDFYVHTDIPEENISIEMQGNELIITDNGVITKYHFDRHTDDVEEMLLQHFRKTMGDVF